MDMGESIIASENGSNRDHVMTNNLMDLSNVRVLLCDTDVESCQEVLALLKKCCYQGNISANTLFYMTALLPNYHWHPII